MRPGIVAGNVPLGCFFTRPNPLHAHTMQAKAWFLLPHKHKHKDIRTRRKANLTQYSIPALLNPMINKMAHEVSAILLFICLHEVWVKVTYDWSTAFSYACAYVNRVFTSQSYDINISARRTRTCPFFLLLVLMLMSTQFSFALLMCLCLCLCARENQA